MKAVVLEKFATVGLPDVDSSGSISSSRCGRNWSMVALSQQLIHEQELLKGLHRLNSRSLDLVIIGNSNRIALLNLQAFKLFPSHLATSMIRQSLAHHFTADGNLLFGILSSGDLFVLTDHLQTIKNIQKPYFIKLSSSSSTLPWYSRVSLLLSSKGRPDLNQITPAETPSHRILIPSWLPSSSKLLPQDLFPFLTAVPSGFAILCCLSPQDCFIFTTSYSSALRSKSIANFKGSSVPGRWQRIIMDKSFIPRWLEDKEQLYFEGKLKSDKNEVISGALIYSALEHTQFHLVFGLIFPSSGSFRVSWELVHYELDWVLREDSQAINLGSKFISRLSSDCTKVALVINTHIGTYIHVENLENPSTRLKLSRRKMAFCPHANFDDGTLFFKRECWVSDVQWLAEDGYFAVMTRCGSLSIFHASGSPMLIKTKIVGAHPDFEKEAKFYLPVFHPHQISPEKKFPELKWVDSQQVLSCSSGSKIELFSLKRVFNLEENDGELPAAAVATRLKDSLTLLFAQAGKRDGGLSVTDKESEECLGTPSPPGKRGEEYGTTSIPPTTTEDEAGISRRRAPVKYVSVEDDQEDIYGEERKGNGSTEESTSVQPVSRSDYQGSSVDGSWKQKRSSSSDDSAPDTVTNTSRSNILESDEGLPSPSLRGYHSLPHLDLDAPRKRSQVYMADDELSDSPAARRGPVLTPLLPPPPRHGTATATMERQVPSSTATFTTTTGGLTTADTYSPPFTSQSIGPTTATEEEDEKVEVEDNSESHTVQDEEDDGKTSEKEGSKLETEIDEEKEKEGATELEFSEGADIAEKKGESVPPPPPPQVEQVEEKISEAEAVANSPIPTPLSPIEKEEQTDNHNDLSSESKEEKDKPEEKIDTELKEEFPPPPLSQTSSATQSSQTQTPVSNLDDHGTQTIRFDSSSGGPVSDEERTAGATASHPSSAGGAPPSSAKKRCRPFCVITTPPPPSKINSGTVTTVVPKLSRIIEVQSEQLEHNKAVDDQMAYKTILVPGMIPERLRKLTKRRKKKKGEEETSGVQEEDQDQNQNRVERTISLSKLSEKVCQEIVDETSGPPQLESEKGRPCTSQKIWEQAAMQFQAKVGRFVEQKRRRKSTTDVKLFQELNDELNSNPPEAAENSVKESRSVPNAITEEVSERLKSILKRGNPKKSGKVVNSLLWLRDAEPAPPQFKGRTLPHVASATCDHEILAELKRRLQMLKYQQDDTKIGKLMSSWALTSLDTQLPQLNLQDMMIQPPTVFLEKDEVKQDEKPLPPPVSSPEKRPAATTKSTPTVPSQMITTSSFIIAGAPSGIKRNKSHHHLLFKKSMQKVPAPPPPVPPQSPKKRVRKQPIYIAPSMKIPTFTIGPPPKGKGKQAKNSKSKAKIQKTSGPTTPTTATTSKPSSTSTSTRIFVKAKVGKTKINKSPVRASISGFKPRAKSNSTTTVIQTLTSNRRREMNLADRNTIKKVIFVPTSPSSKLFRSNLRKLSIISKKLDADNSRRGGTGQKGKMNEKKTGSTTTLFRKSEGGKQSLKIVPETVEPVFVGGARPTKKVGGGVGLNSNTKGKSVMNFQLSEADREKLARRVSFSDPIAIVKTVSPTDLNENSAAVQLENMSLVIGPGRNSPRRETKSQFSMN